MRLKSMRMRMEDPPHFNFVDRNNCEESSGSSEEHESGEEELSGDPDLISADFEIDMVSAKPPVPLSGVLGTQTPDDYEKEWVNHHRINQRGCKLKNGSVLYSELGLLLSVKKITQTSCELEMTYDPNYFVRDKNVKVLICVSSSSFAKPDVFSLKSFGKMNITDIFTTPQVIMPLYGLRKTLSYRFDIVCLKPGLVGHNEPCDEDDAFIELLPRDLRGFVANWQKEDYINFIYSWLDKTNAGHELIEKAELIPLAIFKKLIKPGASKAVIQPYSFSLKNANFIEEIFKRLTGKDTEKPN